MPILAGLGALMGTLGGDLMDKVVTRRQVLGTLAGDAAAAGAPAEATEIDARVMAREDSALERALGAQVTEPGHPHVGGVADDYAMYHAGVAGGLIEMATAAFVASG